MIMRRLGILLFILLWSVVIWAQQTDYRVKGFLKDAESGQVIDFADVLLFKTGDTKYALQTFPNKKGEFVFDNDPRLTESCRKRLEKNGVDNILTPVKEGELLVATKNIVLDSHRVELAKK